MRRPTGIGLIEVMIAAALGLLLLGLLHRFLIPIIQASTRVSHRANFSERAHHSLNRMSKDLLQSTASALSYKPTDADGNSILAICRRDGLTSTGRSRFEESVIAYYVEPGSRELRRQVWPPGPPATLSVTPDANLATVLTRADLLSFAGTQRAGVLMAPDVEEFEATEAWPPGPVIISRLVLKKELPGRVVRFELKKQTALRN